MIRKFRKKDLETVMELWLIGNIEVHSFIPSQYWRQNFTEIQRVVSIACTYVYEHQGEVKGFISVMEGYLLGLFVDGSIRNHGMGMVLLDCVKQHEDSLTVSIYEKNIKAVRFFMKQHFKVESELTEESTGEKQLMMVWKRNL